MTAAVQVPAAPSRPTPRAGPLARAGAAAVLASTALAVGLAVILAISAPPVTRTIVAHSRTAQPHRLAVRARPERTHRTAQITGEATVAPPRTIAQIPTISPQYGPPPIERVTQPAATKPLRATNGGFTLQAQPWELTADGTWQTEVVGLFSDESGTQQPRLRADVEITAAPGEVVPLDPWLRQTPGVIVTTDGAEAVDVNAVAVSPTAATATLSLPAPPADVATFETVARAIDPMRLARASTFASISCAAIVTATSSGVRAPIWMPTGA